MLDVSTKVITVSCVLLPGLLYCMYLYGTLSVVEILEILS